MISSLKNKIVFIVSGVGLRSVSGYNDGEVFNFDSVNNYALRYQFDKYLHGIEGSKHKFSQFGLCLSKHSQARPALELLCRHSGRTDLWDYPVDVYGTDVAEKELEEIYSFIERGMLHNRADVAVVVTGGTMAALLTNYMVNRLFPKVHHVASAYVNGGMGYVLNPEDQDIRFVTPYRLEKIELNQRVEVSANSDPAGLQYDAVLTQPRRIKSGHFGCFDHEGFVE